MKSFRRFMDRRKDGAAIAPALTGSRPQVSCRNSLPHKACFAVFYRNVLSSLVVMLSKTFAAFLRRTDEGTLSRLVVETTILLAASRTNPATVLRDAATTYKVNTDAIALNVKQEFAAKEKAKKASAQATKPAKKAA